MTQVLPCLRVLHDLIEPDTDTNYLLELFSQQGIRANMVVDLIKSLHDRMKAHKPLFKSAKQVEWALEILGYSFLAPQYQYMRDDKNYLESILAVYEYILCGQVDLEHDGKTVEFLNIEATLDYKEPSHQSIMLKMLCHMTLLFDEKNFEKRFNPLPGEMKTLEEDIKTPVRLCGLALKIYHKFLYKAYPFLIQEHWVTLIKVLIGLARFLLEPQYKVKLPEKVNIACVELLYNTWILSGIQDEELWAIFKSNIHRLIYRANVMSYWAEVCVELTSKLLTDQKCFETPTLVIMNDKKQMEFQKNMLIIYHAQQSALGDIEFHQKSKCLLPQPFIFRISRKQTIYLWSKMVTLVQNGNFHHDPKTHSLILKGVSNVISLLLKTGVPYKTNPGLETRHRSNTVKYARKITIKHDSEYFKRTLKSLLQNDKVRPKGDNTLDIAPELETLTDLGGFTTPSDTASLATELESPVMKRYKSAREKSRSFDYPQESGVYAKNQKAPSADFLLKLFGKLLFEALDSSLTSSEEVRLTSITTLCQIFTKARGPFSTVYLKKFYRTYLQYLKEENFSNTLQTLLKHSCHLFKSITTADSIIIQIPLLKKLLNYYYNGGRSEAFMQDFTLRGPSNKLYSSLICPLMNNSLFIDQAYSQERNITDILHDLLNHALQRDKEALLCGRHYAKTLAKETKNLARSSWNFMIYSFARRKISPFIANINDLWLEKSLPTLNKLTLDIFQTLAELCLTNVSTFKTDDTINDTAFAGFMISEKINTFLQQRLPQPNEVKKPTSLTSLENDEARNLASYALLVLYSWTLLLLYFKNRFNSLNKREFYSMFSTTMATLQAFSAHDPFSYHVQNILEMISGNLGNLNCTRNLPFTGSILLNSEEKTKLFSTVSKELEEQSLVHLAPNEDTVLSFYDFNVQSSDESVIVIARNIAGKSIWSGNLFYKLPYRKEKEHDLFTKTQQEKDLLSQKNEGLKDIKAQFSRLSQARKEKYAEKEPRKDSIRGEDEGLEKTGLGQKQQVSSADFKKAMESQFDEEDLYEEQFLKEQVEKLEQSPRGRSQSAQERVIEKVEFSSGGKDRLGKINSIKMLLSNAGLLSMSYVDHLVYIPKSKDTFEWFRQIDQISTRTQIQANILYVADTSVDSIQELNAQDDIFNGFVDDLGLVINSETLELGAFETVREYINQYQKIIYASNVLYEFVFTVANLINSDTAERKILEIPITIVWNARLSDSHDKSIPMIINKLKIRDYRTAIIITPLINGSYLIDVLKQEPTFCLFPQLKGFVCGRDILSSIVLQAVTNIYREYQVHSEQLSYLDVSIGNLAQRKKNMSALVAHYKTRSDSSEALKVLLGSTRTELNSPSFKGK